MRFLLAFVILLPIIACTQGAWSDDPQPDNNLVPFMRAKLQHAHKALEGLALEDFELVGKSAQELSLISQAENWQILQTAEYRRQSAEFRRAADSLKKAADKKNIEACTLSYMNMTMRCMECHRYVRSVQAAAIDDSLLQARLGK
jgi:hypothetical protein